MDAKDVTDAINHGVEDLSSFEDYVATCETLCIRFQWYIIRYISHNVNIVAHYFARALRSFRTPTLGLRLQLL